MQLPKTFLGAVIGAAVGLAFYLTLEVGAGVRASWFAIAIGLLTGLGVRMLDSTVKTHGSVVRAALSLAVALAAIAGGSLLASQLIKTKAERQSNLVSTLPVPDTPPTNESGEEQAATEDAGGESADESAKEPSDKPEAEPLNEAEQRARSAVPESRLTGQPALPPTIGGSGGRSPFSVAQFLFMAIGGLLAYETARGKEARVNHSDADQPGEGAGADDGAGE